MIQPSFEGFVTKGGAGGAVDDTNEAVARSIYVFSMRKWMQTFNRSQIHIVNGESLVKTPWVELNKVERFVGLPQEISKANFEFVHSKGFHCLRLQQYKHHSNRKYVKCLAKTKGRRHPKVRPELMHKLRAFFRPYNFEFYDLIGNDHGWPED